MDKETKIKFSKFRSLVSELEKLMKEEAPGRARKKLFELVKSSHEFAYDVYRLELSCRVKKMFPKDIVQSLPETSRPNVWSLRPDVPAPLPAKVKAKAKSKAKPKKDSTPPEVIRSQVLQLTLEGKSMREIAKVINRTASQVWRHQTALRKEGALPVLSKPDNSPTKAE